MAISLTRKQPSANPQPEIAVLEVIYSGYLVSIEKCLWQNQMVLAKRLCDDAKAKQDVLERFNREAEVLERLDHPNITTLAYRENGLMLREYVEGRTLFYHLEQGALPLGRALEIARSLLAALAHAHGRGIIHLDLKPGNILIEDNGRVKVIDFGCAKDLTLESITHMDARLGTPHYMAPEQFRGVRSDKRSDVYSIGAILYEMTMGQKPFGHDPFGWLLGRGTSPSAWPENLGLRGVLERALQREPEERFENALAMLAALEGIDV